MKVRCGEWHNWDISASRRPNFCRYWLVGTRINHSSKRRRHAITSINRERHGCRCGRATLLWKWKNNESDYWDCESVALVFYCGRRRQLASDDQRPSRRAAASNYLACAKTKMSNCRTIWHITTVLHNLTPYRHAAFSIDLRRHSDFQKSHT